MRKLWLRLVVLQLLQVGVTVFSAERVILYQLLALFQAVDDVDALTSVQAYRLQNPQVARLPLLEEMAHGHDVLLNGHFMTSVRAGFTIAADFGNSQARFEKLQVHLTNLERLYGREQIFVRFLVESRIRRLLNGSFLRVITAFNTFL